MVKRKNIKKTKNIVILLLIVSFSFSFLTIDTNYEIKVGEKRNEVKTKNNIKIEKE